MWVLLNVKEIKKLIYNIEIPKSDDILKEVINKEHINKRKLMKR